jgi:hypothetical protein
VGRSYVFFWACSLILILLYNYDDIIASLDVGRCFSLISAHQELNLEASSEEDMEDFVAGISICDLSVSHPIIRHCRIMM